MNRFKYFERFSPQRARTLEVLRAHPGINARAFAGLRWPHQTKGNATRPVGDAARYLRTLKKMGIVRIRYSGDPFKDRVECIYYLSDYGFEISEYYRIIYPHLPNQN